ncbi:13304_t:CDS:2, partial [Acaulospora colombiana]
MGGGHHTSYAAITNSIRQHDPAIERWYNMREDIYKNFRFTPYAARRVLLWGVAVPAVTVYVLYDHMLMSLRNPKAGSTPTPPLRKSIPTVTSSPATGLQPTTPSALATEISITSNSLVTNDAGSVQPSVSSSFTASPNTATDSGSSSKINRTALIGIIVGGSAFILLIFLIALFYILRRRKRRRGLPDKLPPSTVDEESKPPIHQEPSKPVSFEQPRKRSIGEGPVYEAVNHEAQDSPIHPNPAFLHEKDKELSSEATTPNMRH